MSVSLPTSAVLNGGLLFQKLSPAQMILRRHYFAESGIFAPGLQSEQEKGDLIQVCYETCEITISRDNLLYINYRTTPAPFDDMMGIIVEDIFKVIEE